MAELEEDMSISALLNDVHSRKNKLEARRKDIQTLIGSIMSEAEGKVGVLKAEAETIGKELELATSILTQNAATSGRRSHVLRDIRIVMENARSLGVHEWSHAFFIEKVQEKFPDIINSSASSAIRRLATGGELKHDLLEDGPHYYFQQKPDDPEKPKAVEKVEKAVDEPASPVEMQVYSLIVSGGKKGKSLKDIAWKVEDRIAAEVAVNALIRKGEVTQTGTFDDAMYCAVFNEEEPSQKPLFGSQPSS
jgi:hypothetical protein